MPARIGRRLLALAAFAAAALAAYLAVQPLLAPRPTAGVEAATLVRLPRPRSAPAQVPAWAWQLDHWLLHGGRRPRAAPAYVPNWFWAWRRWRLSRTAAAPPPA